MNAIRAFVGHSFNKADEQVVKTFLDFLDGVGDVIPNFSWRHAERPEPRVVTEKVLELFEDKNVFIGICTKKERVVSEPDFGKRLFGKYLISSADIVWKASDWVIQEIGLAIGRGLKVVLLLEEGVRVPGALQGNLEYITFSRAAPEQCLNKFLLMLGSLKPNTGSQAEKGLATQQVSTDQEEMEVTKQLPPAPKEASTQRDYEFAIIRASALDDQSELKRIDDDYRQSPLFAQADNAACWEAYKEYAKIRFGKGGDLDKLIELANQNASSSRPQRYVGSIYQDFEDFDEASKWFARAAAASHEVISRLKYLQLSVSAQVAGGKDKAADFLLAEMKKLAMEAPAAEAIVLRASIDAFEKRESMSEALVAAMERSLELNPTNHDVRFALAYKYSELQRNDLSILHYSRIPENERSAVAWNNLGVGLEGLALPGKAVAAYREAEVLGETLAMSNLANKQIAAGFLKEAAFICEEASKIADHHKNVDESFRRLKEVPAEEEKREDQLLQKARATSRFARSLGRAVALPDSSELPVEWTGPDCKLHLIRVDDQVRLTGSFIKKELGLRRLLINTEPTQGKDRPYEVEYTCAQVGAAYFGEVTRKPKDDVVTILGSLAATAKVSMWWDEAANLLHVLEVGLQNDSKEYVLTAVRT